MQRLNQLIIDHQHTLFVSIELGPRCDDLASMGDRFGVRRKHSIGGLDLTRMNQALAIKSQLAACFTAVSQAVTVLQVKEHAVNGIDVRCPGRQHKSRQSIL